MQQIISFFTGLELGLVKNNRPNMFSL